MNKKSIDQSRGRAAEEVAKTIQQTFSDFGVETEIVEAVAGLRFYHCYFRATNPVRMKIFSGFADDLKYALETDTIEIEAPVPGKKLVGVTIPIPGEVPLLEWDEYRDRKEHIEGTPLTVPVGKDEFGEDHFADIARLPHMLIGGTTGSGKSNFLKSTINYLITRHDPDVVRFIMVDPKRVELVMYDGIPHLLTPVITEARKTLMALKWCIKEMERRYDILVADKCRDIEMYHKKVYAPAKAAWVNMGSRASDRYELPEAMPYIVIIFDEIADIMHAYPRELELSLIRLAQMARAVGIHMIISTQRPSVSVVTGMIKANIPTRLAFAVASKVDSRTILDIGGAEELRGPGNGLWLDLESVHPINIQTPVIDDKQVEAVVKDWIRKENGDLDTLDFSASDDAERFFTAIADGEDDELYEDAKAAVIKAGKASTSLIQRALRVGYSRAARLMDLLEEGGVIGPADGSAPRAVYGSKDDIKSADDPTSIDDLYEDAYKAVVEAGKASTAYLQRKLRIGYTRAVRLMDLLERHGVIGPQEGSKPREILIDPDEE